MREDIVTIDGPTSSGKNSVGFLLAQRLGYAYVDTGMIYRALSLKILQQNVSTDNLEKILQLNRELKVRFENNGQWKMFLDESDVTDMLHSPQISNLVHVVAAIPEVREVTRHIQKKVAEQGRVVMGGRDIGSEIFPDAKHKFFLTASVEERARRRFSQLVTKDPATKYEDVLSDMKDRDTHDATRKASPMRIPEDAIVIDNTDLNIEETVEEMVKYITVGSRQ